MNSAEIKYLDRKFNTLYKLLYFSSVTWSNYRFSNRNKIAKITFPILLNLFFKYISCLEMNILFFIFIFS